MQFLQIVTCAYRATLEEQDDTVIWFTRAGRSAGIKADVLLTGSAVNYAVTGQDAAGLKIGRWMQTRPPALDTDIEALVRDGARVTAIREDVADRGLSPARLLQGVALMSRRDLAQLVEQYDRVLRW